MGWCAERGGGGPSGGPAAATALAVALLAGCQDRLFGETPMTDEDRRQERTRMVEEQIAGRGIRDGPLLAAMRRVPRHRFVPPSEAPFAYDDGALPIGEGQTISQPFVVAFMTQALQLTGREKVLEVGTGSGYQAAVLAELGVRLFTIELVPALAERAARTLRELGYANVQVRIGDGSLGWPQEAPFDAIIVTAAAPAVPPALLEQLAVGGRLILPVGEGEQMLVLYRRTPQGYHRAELLPVAFVPLRGGSAGGAPAP